MLIEVGVVVGAGVELVTEEVGAGGPAVSKRFRRLRSVRLCFEAMGKRTYLSITCTTPFATIKLDSMIFAALTYVSPS